MDDLAESLIPLTAEQRVGRAIAKLPTLSADQVPLDDSCPICLVPFSTIVHGSGQNDGVLDAAGTPDPIKLCGVTKLDGCGHFFCRVDLIEWIRGRHGTCPACRHAFLDIRPPTDSDNESSDGDYVPDDEDEDEDEGFLDTEDDWEVEAEMDLDGCDEFDMDDEEEVDADLWEDHDDGMDNLGLSDGDSFSEAEVAMSYHGESYMVDNARVFMGVDDHVVQGSSASESENSNVGDPKSG